MPELQKATPNQDGTTTILELSGYDRKNYEVQSQVLGGYRWDCVASTVTIEAAFATAEQHSEQLGSYFRVRVVALTEEKEES